MPNLNADPTSSAPRRALRGFQGLHAALRSPRWHRRALWAVGTLLVIWALAYAAVPVIARSQIEKIASAKLGRAVTVGAVEFKPWSLEFTLHDLVVARAASASSPQGPQLAIKRLYIDGELMSLLRLAPVVDALQVDEPTIAVTHLGEGRYDIDDILERLRPPADQPPGDPQRFALYNLVLAGGSIDFTDDTVHRTHRLRDLQISVPFLSNLASQRDVKTSPRLAFVLNGSRFDTAATGTPFAQTRKTDATLSLRGLDLAPYLGYWPASLPYRLQGAVIDADARVAFEQTPATVVRISGGITVDKLRFTTGPASGAQPLLALDRLAVQMDDVRPLEQRVSLSSVELTAPVLNVVRDKAGRLNLVPAGSGGQAVGTANAVVLAPSAPVSSPASSPAAAASAAVPPAVAAAPVAAAQAVAASPWKIKVDRFAVKSGTLQWLDQTLPSPAEVRLVDLGIEASAMNMPFTPDGPLQFSGSVGLAAGGAPAGSGGAPGRVATAVASPASMSFKGKATDRAAQVDVTVQSWPLAMASKYVGQFLLPALGGQLDARLGVDWQAGQAGQPQVLRVSAQQLSLAEVQLAEGRTSLVSVKRIELAGVTIDVPAQAFRATSLSLQQPKARVDRDGDRRWMYERWLVGARTAPPPPGESTGTAAAAPAWSVGIDDVQVDGGAVSFSDRSGARPVLLEVSGVKARLGKLALGDGHPPGSARPAAAMPLTASMRVAAGRFEPGRIDFNGNLGLAPQLQAEGRLVVERLPVQAFEPYFSANLNVDLLRADASFKGRVAYLQTAGGPQAQVSGDVAVEEFRANTLAPSEDLLAWKALNLRGLKVVLAPARATQVDVRETVLTDFFARVIVMPDGRINLQDLLKPAGQASVGADTATARAAPASAASTGGGPVTVARAAPVVAPASGPAAVVRFGPMSVVNGKVLFSDRFVKPNYSADLSELTGKLSAFSSEGNTTPGGAPALADLELRGKAESTASLEILGKLNPLAKPLALDIKGKVRDLELPPLSPYSVKYSGYGITRGKLDVDVAYVVLPDGRLTASNKVVLNQLSFGDKVAGSTASLPVKLAVALLADRNGVIDIDLPISGSLNDPQFSLGPVIVKVIINVIVKAITAPFSLLANALGGSADEMGVVAFPPGSARLAPEARASLDKVAKALTDRPSLRLTVVGTSSLESERDGFQRERLQALVQAEKRRETVKAGGDATTPVIVTPAEYPALLEEVYKRADMPKPRNLVGLAKTQPVNEMEKLLLADVKVTDDAMRELAVRRGVAVKDYLAGRGLPQDRLFLGAAKSVSPEAKWTPRAELNLATP